MPPLPAWTWRNIIALIALGATIAGAAVLTWVVWWMIGVFGEDADRLITELVRDRQARPEVGQVLIIIYEAMAWGLKLLLGGIIVVLLSLGLAITARKLNAEAFGGKLGLEGGDADEAAVQGAKHVREAAETAEQEVKDETR